MSTHNHKLLSKELNTAIKLIGDSHVLCIIVNLEKQGMRFCELQRAINGLNPTTLSNRLKRLEQEQIVSRQVAAIDKVSVLYELTDKGRAILPIVKEIGIFAEKFL